jgi:hypothetical protein
MNIDLVPDRLRDWRDSVQRKRKGSQLYPGCILACDALAFKPRVEVTDQRITGLDLANSEFHHDRLDAVTRSSAAFCECVQANWDDVFEDTFVFHVQSLRRDLPPVIVYAEPATDGIAQAREVDLSQSLKLTASRMSMTVGIFATDGDSGCDLIHEKKSEINCRAFE